jgi:hypothetical protein
MAGIGHLGFGFAAKRLAPRAPLAILLVASEAIDLIYLILILARVDGENATYLTHSLFMSGVWTIAITAIVFMISRSARSAVVVGLVVFAHWVLDAIVWPMTAIFPDATGMPLFFQGSPRIGLGLYRWFAMAIICEAFLFLGGIAIPLRKIRRERSTAWK